jgi:ankyrin repeat protein
MNQKFYFFSFTLVSLSFSLAAMEEPSTKRSRSAAPEEKLQNERGIDSLTVTRQRRKELGKALGNALVNNNLAEVERLLKEGADPNIDPQGINHSSFLNLAIEAKNLKMVKLLIHYGAKVNDFRDEEYSPLHMAASYNAPITHYLLQHGADANNDFVYTNDSPLQSAMSVKSVQLLLEQGADVNRERTEENGTPLDCILRAIQDQDNNQEVNLCIIKELLAWGAKFDPESPVTKKALCAAFKKQPLTLAAVLGQAEEVIELSEVASPSEISEALTYATAQGHKGIIFHLLGKGISVEKLYELIARLEKITQYRSLAPYEREYYESIRQQYLRRLPTLVDQIISRPALRETINLLGGINYLSEDIFVKINPTAILLRAVKDGNASHVAMALKEGANPNAQDENGLSALALAALHDDCQAGKAMITELMCYGAIVPSALIPILLAKDEKRHEIVATLRFREMQKEDSEFDQEEKSDSEIE